MATKRQVQLPLISYRDDDGLLHHALKGTTVEVGQSYLKEFDALNDPERRSVKKAAEAPPRGGPKKKAAKKV